MSNIPQTNPLAAYMRLPGLNVPLPTGGAFLPESEFTPAEDGTVPILPMRAADEYLLKNADALLSGLAIQKLLESCVPAIKNPSLVSTPDLDVLLLAIRAATYGELMEVGAVCPKCGTENAFDCHLPSVLATMKPVPSENPVRLSDEVIAYVRPYNFRNATQIALVTFQETRKVQALQMDPEASETQKTAQMNSSLERIANLQADMLAECVYQVATPDGVVNSPEFIAEFVGNISSIWVSEIGTKLSELNENYGIDKTVQAKCSNPKCQHEWETNIEFDPASFFGTGS